MKKSLEQLLKGWRKGLLVPDFPSIPLQVDEILQEIAERVRIIIKRSFLLRR